MLEDIKKNWPIAAALVALIVVTFIYKKDAFQLWSGFLGAIFGAWATLQSSRSAIQETENIERSLRKETERARLQSILGALKAEAEFNLQTLSAQGDAKLVDFSKSAWEAFFPYLKGLNEDVKEPLQKAYCAIIIHEKALNLELARGSAGPNVLANNVHTVRVNLEKALDGGWLLIP